MNKRTNIKFNDCYAALFQPKKYKVFFGGRFSGKSNHIALALLTRCSGLPTRVLCAREYQTSIKKSVHQLLCDLITQHDLHHIPDKKDKNGKVIKKGKPGFIITDNEIAHSNGSQITFAGLKTNISNVKSMANIDICWIEEAENVSENSWSVLIPTIRNPGSEFWISFNPKDESDPTYQRFVKPFISTLNETKVYQDEKYYVRHINFDENLMFIGDNETIMSTIDEIRENDPLGYEHYILGKPVGQNDLALISGIWFDAAIDAHKKLNFQPGGQRQIGFDPADGGSDAQGVVHREGNIVLNIDKYMGINVESGCQKIYQYCMDNTIRDIVYDGIGIGVGARVEFNRLDAQSINTYSGFIGSESPTVGIYIDGRLNKDVYKNLRAMQYWQLRDRFYQTYRAVQQGVYVDPEKMISISSDCKYIDELRKELTQIQRKQNTALIQVESKADMKQRGLKSPNIADALVYAFAPVKKQIKVIDIDFGSEWN